MANNNDASKSFWTEILETLTQCATYDENKLADLFISSSGSGEETFFSSPEETVATIERPLVTFSDESREDSLEDPLYYEEYSTSCTVKISNCRICDPVQSIGQLLSARHALVENCSDTYFMTSVAPYYDASIRMAPSRLKRKIIREYERRRDVALKHQFDSQALKKQMQASSSAKLSENERSAMERKTIMGCVDSETRQNLKDVYNECYRERLQLGEIKHDEDLL